MNTTATPALDARHLRGAAADPVRSLSAAWLDLADAEDHFAQADRADQALLRLVGCAAGATLLLALAASLGV